jgi:tetratricopeptide (TPR) repeat protein
LINHDTTRRYRFHSLLRRYATARAAAEDDRTEIARARHRLLDWYLLSAAGAMAVIAPEWPAMPDLPDASVVEPIHFRTEPEAMKWCEAERDNLFAVSLWAAEQGFDRHAWQIPGVLHELLERNGFPGDVLGLNQRALGAARRDGHEVGQIGTLTNLGTTYFALHDYEQALAAFTAAQEFAGAHGHIEEETICLHNLATTCLSLGEAERAVGIFEDALLICRKIANPAGEAAILHRLGEAHLRLMDYSRSAECLQQALTLRQRIGSKRGIGQTHSGLAALYLAVGRRQLALRHSESALAIHELTGDQRAECATLITLAAVQRELGRHDDAVRSGLEALRLGEHIFDSVRQVEALTELGRAHAATGDVASATPRIRAAARILDGLSGVLVPPLRERLAAAEHALRLVAPEPWAS